MTSLARHHDQRDRCALLQPVPECEQHLATGTNDPAAVLRLVVGRLEQMGIETFGLDLTRPRFAVPVARVIAPGLQLEPSGIVTPRLARYDCANGRGDDLYRRHRLDIIA